MAQSDLPRPPRDPEQLVDIQFRNGWIARGVMAGKYRYGPCSRVHDSPGDIVRVQIARGE
jgi:hypothetical protein